MASSQVETGWPSIPAAYHELVIWIGDGTGLPDAILHIHAGLAILMVVRLVSRRSLGSFIPFGVVVVAELLNELLDYLHYGMRWDDTLADIANTLFWPLVISLGVRLRPMIVRTPGRRRSGSSVEGDFAGGRQDRAGGELLT